MAPGRHPPCPVPRAARDARLVPVLSAEPTDSERHAREHRAPAAVNSRRVLATRDMIAPGHGGLCGAALYVQTAGLYGLGAREIILWELITLKMLLFG